MMAGLPYLNGMNVVASWISAVMKADIKIEDRGERVSLMERLLLGPVP